MRALARLISRRHEMPNGSGSLMRLRTAHYTLKSLPDTIASPRHPFRDAEVPLALDQATIDDVAFARVAAEQERTAADRHSSALKRLYKSAREAGGAGVDLAVASALKRERN